MIDDEISFRGFEEASLLGAESNPQKTLKDKGKVECSSSKILREMARQKEIKGKRMTQQLYELSDSSMDDAPFQDVMQYPNKLTDVLDSGSTKPNQDASNKKMMQHSKKLGDDSGKEKRVPKQKLKTTSDNSDTNNKHNTENTQSPKPKRTKTNDKDIWIKNTTHSVFFIERQTVDQKPLHPMELAKILNNIGIKDYKELKSAGQGRYRITFNRPRDAEMLINSKLLTEEFKHKVYVPNMLKESIGIIRRVPISLTEEEILDNIKTDNNQKVVRIERIKRMVNEALTLTTTVKIFVEGQKLPNFISIFGVYAKVDIYIFPLKMCTKCYRYGHKIKTCKSTTSRCENCSAEHDSKDCTAPAKCYHCNGSHKITDKSCPERIRQDKIRYLMAEEKLTFLEAAFRLPRNNSVQYRLNSSKDFPNLPTSNNNSPPSDIIQQSELPNDIRSQNLPQNQTTNLKQYEINKIIQTVKSELLQQLNIDTLINKMKTIQNTITNHANQHKSKKNSIDTDILLINISDQIRAIIEPEVKLPAITPETALRHE